MARTLDSPERFPAELSTASYAHNPDLSSQNSSFAGIVHTISPGDWLGKRSWLPKKLC